MQGYRFDVRHIPGKLNIVLTVVIRLGAFLETSSKLRWATCFVNSTRHIKEMAGVFVCLEISANTLALSFVSQIEFTREVAQCSLLEVSRKVATVTATPSVS